jgi:hypothetical protein
MAAAHAHANSPAKKWARPVRSTIADCSARRSLHRDAAASNDRGVRGGPAVGHRPCRDPTGAREFPAPLTVADVDE